MKILRDHIVKEFLRPFFFSLFSFIFVFMIGRSLVQMADLIFNKDVDVIFILKILFLSLPFILTFVIPMSVLVASLLAFGRLSLDNEIMAIRASGISLTKVLSPLFAIALILSLFTFLLSDRIASVTHYAYRQLFTQMGMSNPSAVLEEGTFIKKFKNFVIFIYEIDKNNLKGIRIYQPQEGKPTRTIVAERGVLLTIPEQNMIKLRLVRGTSDEPDPKDPSKLYKLNFRTYDLPLSVPSADDPEKLGKKPKDMTIKELKNEIRELGVEGIKATYPLSAEIHNKIAVSFSSLAFLLIGIPLGITTRRQEKSINFAISLGLLILYWMLLIGGKALADRGLVPAFLSLEFSNVALGICGILFFRKMVKN